VTFGRRTFSAACKDFSAPVYFQTSVTLAKSDEGPVAVFHWLSLGAATAGQKQVQATVAATHGDEEKLYEAIQHEPSLDKACVTFAGRRDLCGVGQSSDSGPRPRVCASPRRLPSCARSRKRALRAP
jgi:hypothetical protein